MMGHVRKPGCRRRSRALSRRPQRPAARGGGGDRGASIGPRRRRHRQDPGIDHQARPYRGIRPGVAEPDPRGDLHQQGGARDARSRRRADRRCGRWAVDRHLPRSGGTHAQTARGGGGAPPGLHHPRRRRPDPPGQVSGRGCQHRFEPLARAVAARGNPAFQGSRAGAGEGFDGGRRGNRRRPDRTALHQPIGTG